MKLRSTSFNLCFFTGPVQLQKHHKNRVYQVGIGSVLLKCKHQLGNPHPQQAYYSDFNESNIRASMYFIISFCKTNLQSVSNTPKCTWHHLTTFKTIKYIKIERCPWSSLSSSFLQHLSQQIKLSSNSEGLRMQSKLPVINPRRTKRLYTQAIPSQHRYSTGDNRKFLKDRQRPLPIQNM